jgi:hypothetical protein
MKIKRTRDFKAVLAEFLKLTFDDRVSHNAIIVGHSNKPHKFANVVLLPNGRRLIVDPAAHDASSINARVVSNLDVIPTALRLDLCPVAESDRGDGGLVVGKEIPGLTAFIDDVAVVIIDGYGELVLSQVFPDILDRIEFWRVGRQGQKADVVWRLETRGGVISSAVEGEDGVRPGCDFFADFSQMKGKCFGVGVWQDESGRGTARRTNRPEDIGPFVA